MATSSNPFARITEHAARLSQQIVELRGELANSHAELLELLWARHAAHKMLFEPLVSCYHQQHPEPYTHGSLSSWRVEVSTFHYQIDYTFRNERQLVDILTALKDGDSPYGTPMPGRNR